MGGFSSFNFNDADSLFKHFFASSGFDNEEDEDFFGSFFGKKKGKKTGFGFPSMFDDDFFGGGFGNMGNMGGFGGTSTFSSSTSYGGGGKGGLSKSVSTVTKTVNGKTVTTKKTTVVNPDGTKNVTEETIEGGKKLEKKYSLGPGQSSGKAVNYY